MADNQTVDNGTLTDYVVSADEIVATGAKVQRIKLACSADGSETHVQADADGLLVNLGANNDITVAGVATAAAQTTIIGHLDGVEGVLATIDADTSTLAGAVSGTEVQVDVVAALPAGTNAIGKLAANSGVDIGDVDVTSLPATVHSADFDSGAGTDTTLAFGIAVPASGGAAVVPGDATAGLKVDLGADNDVTVTGTVTVTGVATAANQTTANASLATIAGAVAGTEVQADVLTVPAPLSTTGAGTEATALRVTLASDSTGLVSVDDNGGSLTVDAPVGTPAFVRLSDGAAAITTLPVSVASVPSHAVTNAGTFAVQVDGAALTALQLLDDAIAGTEMQVDIVSMPAVDTELTTADLDTGAGTDTRAVVGLVGSASGGGAIIPGSATDGLLVNLGANNDVALDAASLAALESITVALDAASLAALESITATGPLTDTQLRATPVPVSAASLPLPTGASTLAEQQTQTTALSAIQTATQLIDDAAVADDAAFTPATTKVLMAGYEFDDTTPDSVDEGDAGAARMSARREVYVQLRDAAGNERGLNVDASGNVGVTDAAGSLTVDGTVAATQSGAWNVTNVSGTVSLPTGAATAAKQPALGTAGAASADVITVQGIASGTAQPVSVASLPLPSGASTSALQGGGLPAALGAGGGLKVEGSGTAIPVTASAGTNLNTSLLALEAGGNLAALAASASVLDDWDETNRAAVNLIAGQVGIAGGTGTDGATVPRVTLATNVALPAGTAAIGRVGHDQTGIGDGRTVTPSAVTLATSAAADDIIDTSGSHGYSAGDEVRFPTLTGGAGLVAGTHYFVSATSLAATTFRVSAALVPDTPLGFTTDITAGTVVKVRTALASTTVAKTVLVVAETDNTGVLVVGAAATVVAAQATRRGVPLSAGESLSLAIDDLMDIGLDSTVAGDGATYVYTS